MSVGTNEGDFLILIFFRPHGDLLTHRSLRLCQGANVCTVAAVVWIKCIDVDEWRSGEVGVVCESAAMQLRAKSRSFRHTSGDEGGGEEF